MESEFFFPFHKNFDDDDNNNVFLAEENYNFATK